MTRWILSGLTFLLFTTQAPVHAGCLEDVTEAENQLKMREKALKKADWDRELRCFTLHTRRYKPGQVCSQEESKYKTAQNEFQTAKANFERIRSCLSNERAVEI